MYLSRLAYFSPSVFVLGAGRNQGDLSVREEFLLLLSNPTPRLRSHEQEKIVQVITEGGNHDIRFTSTGISTVAMQCHEITAN